MGSPFSKTHQSTENTQREEELSKTNNDLQEKIIALEKKLRNITDILKEERLSYESTFGIEQLSLTSPESTENTEHEDLPNQVSNQISSHYDTLDDQSSIHHTDNYQNVLDKSLSQIDVLIAAYVAKNPHLAGLELDYNKIVTRPVRKLINENQKLKQEKQVLVHQNAEQVCQLQMEKVTVNGYYQNVRGLRTKLTKLRCTIQRLNYDFFTLTETWLNDSFSELDFTGYTIFRTDRCSNTSLYSRGGGVAIFVKKNSFISALQIYDPCDNVEQVFVEVKLNSYEKVVLGACYIPPNSPNDVYSSHIKSIETILSKFDNNIKVFGYG